MGHCGAGADSEARIFHMGTPSVRSMQLAFRLTLRRAIRPPIATVPDDQTGLPQGKAGMPSREAARFFCTTTYGDGRVCHDHIGVGCVHL